MAGHLAALLVLAVQALAGHALLARLRLSGGLSVLEQMGFGWAAGFSLSSACLLVLAAGGWLVPAATGLLFAGLAVICLPAARTVSRRAASALASLRASRRQRAAALAGIALALVWVWPLFVQTLLPNTDWDSALYQLPLADRYLAGAVFGDDPYFPAYAFPGAVNLLYAALMSLGLEAAIIPLNFYAALLGLALAAGLALRLGGRAAAGWAALVLTSVPLFWQVGVDPRVDVFLCLCVTLALHALYLLTCRRDEPSLCLLGLALGAALGCKYTAVFYGAGFSAIAIALVARRVSRGRGPGVRVLAVTAGLYLLLLLVPNGVWYAANAVIHGDPLFPMLRGHYVLTDDGERRYLASEREPLAAGLLDSPTLRAAANVLSDAPAAAPPTHLFDVPDLLARPDDYAVKPNHGVGPLPFLSLLLPLVAALWWKPEPRARRAGLVLWAAAWGSYALLGSQTNLLRYVLPAFPAFAAMAGLVIASTPFRFARAAVALLAGLLLLSSHLAEIARLEVLRAAEARALPADGLGGFEREARIEWLKRVGWNFTPAMAAATGQINAFVRSGRMQSDDLVLMVGEGKGRLLACRYLPDGSWFAHRFVAAFENAGEDDATLAKRLRERGVTHILYNRGYFEDWVVPNTRTDRSRVARAQVHLERFLADHGRTIFRGPGIELVELGQRSKTSKVSEESRLERSEASRLERSDASRLERKDTGAAQP